MVNFDGEDNGKAGVVIFHIDGSEGGFKFFVVFMELLVVIAILMMVTLELQLFVVVIVMFVVVDIKMMMVLQIIAMMVKRIFGMTVLLSILVVNILN